MPEINATVVVEPINLTVAQDNIDLGVTVEPINLNVFTGQAIPAGIPGQLQYNDAGAFGAVTNTDWDGFDLTLGPVANVKITGGTANYFLQTDGAGNLTWQQVTAAGGNTGELQYNIGGNLLGGIANTNVDANGNLVFNNLSNLKIAGGSNGYSLTTDGAGNLTWNDATTNANYANFAGEAFLVDGSNVSGAVANATYANSTGTTGTVTTNAQPNITSVGTLTSLDVSGNATLGNLDVSGISNLGPEGNVIITGGTNGYFLQTDGTGNLSWVAGGGSGNGTVGGSNTQIQFNDAGAFGGNAFFTFDKTTGNVQIPGNLALDTVNSTLLNTTGLQVGIFPIPGLANVYGTLNVTGTGLLTAVTANISGNVNAGNVNTSNLNITGDISATGNIDSTSGIFNGDGYGLSNISAGNVSGQVGNALVAGTVYTNAQPNITSVGTLTSLDVSGTTSIYEAIENVSQIGAQTGTYNYDLLDGAIQYSTANATANVTLNFRGNASTTLDSILASGKSIIGTYIMTTDANAYGIAGVEIDGTAQTIDWAGGGTPLFVSNTKASFTFTCIKTSATPTYVVLGSMTRYG